MQPATIGELGHLCPQRLQLPAHRHLKSQLLAHRPDLHRTIGGPNDLKDPAVVGGQRHLVGIIAAVRDQQHRTPRHLRLHRSHRNGSLRLQAVLLGQTVQHPLGNHQLLPLRLDLPKPLAQLLGERVQLAPASRDPPQLGHPRSLPAI
ncbi:hypothetical protein ACFYO0_08850 [Streptomyces sp. NPDC006365]|uniref:hypothetical protein n=1 Tax=Streptomyces sp. NPDC006365 TaxID=3364744 RepID=UPI0036D0BD8D